MAKKEIGAKTALYPMPVTIVGANVEGKPNFLTIAWCSIISRTPPLITVSLGKNHYSNPGIKGNKTFSVNIPSREMLLAADYCGIVSGEDVDKSNVFQVFYGKLKTAPMISECPVSMECRLVHILDLGGPGETFVGEIVESYSDEKYLTRGLPDMTKIQPIVFSPYDNNYWEVGANLGPAFKIGKEYK